MSQLVYFFGSGKAEGTKDMRAVLGGKGANLAEMTNLGVPVPPGFTIACACCVDYLRDGDFPDALREEIRGYLRRVEEATGRGFGDARNPLLVSVRSGAVVGAWVAVTRSPKVAAGARRRPARRWRQHPQPKRSLSGSAGGGVG